MLIGEFIYNNAKNVIIWLIFFELNYKYHLCILFKKNINLCLKSKLINKLANKLKNLIIVYKKNFNYTKQFLKQTHNKDVKHKIYSLSDKICSNYKHIKKK